MLNSTTVISKDEPAINMSGITNSMTSITVPVSARAQLITEICMPMRPAPIVYFKAFLHSSLLCLLLAHLSIAYHGNTPFHLFALSAQNEEPRLRGRCRDLLNVAVGHLGRNLGLVLTATSGDSRPLAGRENSWRFDRR
jgi:hypothetical protein